MTHGKIQLQQNDFCEDFFVSSWYVLLDRFGNGCAIDFPIVVCPRIKYGPRTFIKNNDGRVAESSRMFIEVLCVNLVKKRVKTY